MAELFISIRRLSKLAWVIMRGVLGRQPGDDIAERANWQQRQASRMLRALETEVSVTGTFPNSGLVVSNHLSYLDVIVIAAQHPLVFVAKSDVRKWPVIGLLLKSAGTILAERTRPMSANETAQLIRKVLESGLPVVLFPEGTSSDGSSVLPFKPTLFQIALDCETSITPAAISYHAPNGDVANDVCYWGDHTFLTHLLRLAKIKHLRASLSIGSAPLLPGNRKDTAKLLHKMVSLQKLAVRIPQAEREST